MKKAVKLNTEQESTEFDQIVHALDFGIERRRFRIGGESFTSQFG